MKSSFFLVSFSFFFFGIDLFSKFLAQDFLRQGSYIFWENIFQFSLHYNTGIAFSLAVPKSIQILLTLILLGFGLFFIFKNPPQKKLEILSFSFLIGGALGNFYERIFWGHVTDFIAIWHFPIFNLADTFLFFGVIILLHYKFQKA